MKKQVTIIATIVIAVSALAVFAFPNVDAHELEHQSILQAAHVGTVGSVDYSKFDPNAFLTTWNFNDLAPHERAKFYRETPLDENGTLLREYWIYAQDESIEVAPGVYYAAWTYNGQVPAPTIRATEGDSIRIHFINNGTKPHTMHFHGFHPAGVDGVEPPDFVYPGEEFTYEFDADPAGTHLYHCHSTPIKKHLEKGLYGAYIVDHKNMSKVDKEFIMVMNAFDTNFDGENEVYAVNTVAFAYAKHPIQVKVGELVRMHVINVVEGDPINSIHIHANFFDEFPTGTSLEPTEFTDIIELGQGERSRIEMRFRHPGRYMFHAHQTEFAEKGWMGFFEVHE